MFTVDQSICKTKCNGQVVHEVIKTFMRRPHAIPCMNMQNPFQWRNEKRDPMLVNQHNRNDRDTITEDLWMISGPMLAVKLGAGSRQWQSKGQ